MIGLRSADIEPKCHEARTLLGNVY